MQLKFVSFDDVSAEQWDKWVAGIGESTYLHSSYFLKVLHAMIAPTGSILSFACIENENAPLAICPLGISRNTAFSEEFLETSWNGAPVGAPAFTTALRPSLKGKFQNEIFSHYHQLIRAHGAKRSYVRKHAINLDVLAGYGLPRSQFDLLRYGYECQPQNTLIIDLSNSEEELNLQVSRYQRKHFKQSLKQNLIVKSYGKDADPQQLEAMFSNYVQAHFNAAGRSTRPRETFDLMLDFLKQGQATLFAAFAENEPISYLYCGEFYGFAFGWSQANVERYESTYSPRHYLEWQSILFYKRKGFRFYEVGTVWFGPQPYMKPSEKELSIAEFKRRFGGLLLPELCFEKIFERNLWVTIHETRKNRFISSGYFDDLNNSQTIEDCAGLKEGHGS